MAKIVDEIIEGVQVEQFSKVIEVPIQKPDGLLSPVMVGFKWSSFVPDKRQWRPSRPFIEPIEVFIQIEVPLDHEYIFNATEIPIAREKGDPFPVILTPKGLKYCIDEFEEVMQDVRPAPEKEDWESDEWKEDATSTPSTEKWKESEEEWK